MADKKTAEELTAELSALSAANEKLTSDVVAMQSKMDELLGETKKAKDAKREAEKEQQRIADEKAHKDGDFEQLLKSSEETRQSLQDDYDKLNLSIAKDKVKIAASTIANKLAEGENVGLLSDFIQRRLKHTAEGVKVTDKDGQLTVSSLDDLAKEFSGDARYAALLKGNKSAGGGASGGQNKSGGGTINPWAKSTRNLTEQGRIAKEDPELAAKLKAAS